jgi:hypothetical protein
MASSGSAVTHATLSVLAEVACRGRAAAFSEASIHRILAW